MSSSGRVLPYRAGLRPGREWSAGLALGSGEAGRARAARQPGKKFVVNPIHAALLCLSNISLPFHHHHPSSPICPPVSYIIMSPPPAISRRPTSESLFHAGSPLRCLAMPCPTHRLPHATHVGATLRCPPRALPALTPCGAGVPCLSPLHARSPLPSVVAPRRKPYPTPKAPSDALLCPTPRTPCPTLRMPLPPCGDPDRPGLP